MRLENRMGLVNKKIMIKVKKIISKMAEPPKKGVEMDVFLTDVDFKVQYVYLKFWQFHRLMIFILPPEYDEILTFYIPFILDPQNLQQRQLYPKCMI